LPTQISLCRRLLTDAGYKVTHVLEETWSSTELANCPQFKNLRGLVKEGEIKAVACLDRDRLQAEGLDRLVFLSECREAGVDLLVVHGAPFIDSEEGQIVELALAIGKRRQVLRARQGSKDGLHDRALRQGLPTSYHKLFGYKWVRPGPDAPHPKLVPNADYDTVNFIFDSLLEGRSYDWLIATLKSRGILSPGGRALWNKTAISQMLHNPSYAGRYYALKKEAVEPRAGVAIRAAGMAQIG